MLFRPKIKRIVTVVLGRNSKNASQRKLFSLGWRFVFGGGLIALMFLGIGPVEMFKNSIRAINGRTEVINLYANSVVTDSANDNYEEGWWNIKNGIGAPSLDKTDGFLKFSDKNSAFYSKGKFNLEVGKFLPDKNEFAIEDSAVKKEIKEPEKPAAEDETQAENESQEGPEKTVEVISDITAGENIKVDVGAAASDPAAGDGDEEDGGEIEIIDAPDNGEETEAIIVDVSGGPKEDPVKKQTEESGEAEAAGGPAEDEPEQTQAETQNSKDVQAPPAEESIPQAKDEPETESQAAPAPDSAQEGEGDNKAVSLLRKIKNIFSRQTAIAQEMITGKMSGLSDLGEFKNAKIKLSLAINSHKKEPDNQTEAEADASGEESKEPAGEEPLPGIIGTEDNASEEETVENMPGDSAAEEDGEESLPGDEAEVVGGEESEPKVIMPKKEEEADIKLEETVKSPEKEAAEIETAEPAGDNSGGDGKETSLINKFLNYARAQSGGLGEATLVIWYSVDSKDNSDETEASGDHRLWQKLDTIAANNFSNAVNNGYITYEAPFLSDWEDIENLSIKIEGLVGGDEVCAVYLDSVWVEAEYEPSEAVEKIKKQNALKNALRLLSNNFVFKVNEQGEMKFHYQKEEEGVLDKLGGWLGVSGFWDNIEIRTKIVDTRGAAVDIPLTMIMEDSGEFTIKLPEMPERFKPGDYKIIFVIVDSSGKETRTLEFEQNFSWGVLAINTNKSMYTPLENAYLQMAVLDERGHTLCGADLELEITAPLGTVKNFSTLNGSIVKNPLCGPDNVINTPDYYARYMVYGEGIYKMRLTASTSNGIREMNDEFEVRNEVPFEIERIGPTRIYPAEDYTMRFNIKANEDFSGDFVEQVPRQFSIYNFQFSNNFHPSSEYKEYPISNIKTEETGIGKNIVLNNIKLKQGDEISFTYSFDAPDISPEFYLLGKARMGEFMETRNWQIAADLPAVSTSTNGSAVGWTDSGYAWDNGTDTYATRLVPKKTGSGGEPANYIRSTVNTAQNLSGDITQVQIGVEGKVENTSASFWVQPYFNGSIAGTAQALALGTTDDNQGHYVDITNDTARPNYPAAWTWQEVIDLDINVYGANTSNSRDYTIYVDQIMLQVQYTPNTAPTSTIESAAQKAGTSGTVDVSFSTWDTDGDASRARLEYESGAACSFVGASEATIDETDANATSTFKDVTIDNSSYYQIGTSTGKIHTASGTNNVFIDWQSAVDTGGQEGTYCLGLTVNDFETDQSPIATATVMVDNKAPSAPGSLSEWGTTTKNTVGLGFGATSSDMNFTEYKIFYSTSTPPTEADFILSSSTDANLGNINFNSAATTSINGLLENTTYYFAIWAYDSFGHKSSSSPAAIATNKTPNSEFNKSAAFGEKNDGSGYVDLAFDARDLNSNISTAKIEYEAGSSCLFGGSGDPTLDTSISGTIGSPAINNSLDYQIRNITTSATNTLEFDWLSEADVDGADDTYCFRLTVNDGRDNQTTPVYATTTIDNLDPTGPGAVSEADSSTSTITLFFGATTTETNFSQYKIYYKAGTAGVTEGEGGEFEVSDPDLGDKLFNSTATTTVLNLNPDTNYVFKVWAYDAYGHKASSAEAVIKTAASIQNAGLTFVNPESGNIGIGNGASEYTFRAVVSEENGWTTLDSVEFKLADKADFNTPFDDLKFSWNQSSESFSDNSADIYNAVTLSDTSTSTCAGDSCTLDFNLIFNYDFASSAINYAAELYSTNDSASYDFDSYPDFYQIKVLNVKQIHYRWRNDNGGE